MTRRVRRHVGQHQVGRPAHHASSAARACPDRRSRPADQRGRRESGRSAAGRPPPPGRRRAAFATWLQPPGAAPRSSTRQPGRISWNRSSSSISLNAARERQPCALRRRHIRIVELTRQPASAAAPRERPTCRAQGITDPCTRGIIQPKERRRAGRPERRWSRRRFDALSATDRRFFGAVFQKSRCRAAAAAAGPHHPQQHALPQARYRRPLRLSPPATRRRIAANTAQPGSTKSARSGPDAGMLAQPVPPERLQLRNRARRPRRSRISTPSTIGRR